MDPFDSPEPLRLPGRQEILRELLSLPDLGRRMTAAEMAGVFAALRHGSAAYRVGSELAFAIARWDLSATHPQMAETIGKGLKGSSRSRERTLEHRYPGGTADIIDRIRRQYELLGGQLPEPVEPAGDPDAMPIPMPSPESSPAHRES